ncbi:TetR/AcrR family transcriptional regulator [Nocardia salmonicida]|uniref:TetR/AcrR family transcriptional regulator n=1 Tax=Nocardia salmonicida TaxID=53431 RepID=UPI00378B1D1D
MSVRDRVLQAALECFIEEGYERTSIARIRERSGVSNGALFHHFPTKDSIAGTLYLDAITEIQDGYRQVLEKYPATVARGIDGLIRHQLSWVDTHPDRARFLYAQGRLDQGTEAGSRLRAMNEDVDATFRKWLAPFLARGEVHDLPTAVVVAIVNGPAHSIAQQWLADQLPGPIIDYAEVLTDAAVAGLTGAPVAETPRRSRVFAGRVRVQIIDESGDVVGEGEISPEPPAR